MRVKGHANARLLLLPRHERRWLWRLLRAWHHSGLGDAARCGVRPPAALHLLLDVRFVFLQTLCGEFQGRLLASALFHSRDLVADDLAPVGSILVWLDDSDLVILIVHDDGLLAFIEAFHVAIRILLHGTVRVEIDFAFLNARVDDSDALADQLVRGDDQTERRQRAAVVLQKHAVGQAQHPPAAQTPPVVVCWQVCTMHTYESTRIRIRIE
mmetsp:Transcript_13221/g.36502  ORF Transcript_13221/g.36502 Transcript_13221/m.36502 type:complete len:212 (-) Transcript_13221:181-816(-)